MKYVDTKFNIYYDAEADYLEVRFGEPTAAFYQKIGPDSFARIDEKTGEVQGYAIFNLKKGTSPLRTIDVDLPWRLPRASGAKTEKS